MHEYSIVQALIDQCEQLARQHQATDISKVTVSIGVLSGVEPDLFATAFDSFRLSSAFCQQAELDLQTQPVVIECQECGQTSELTEHCYICPVCNSEHIRLIKGKEMLLMQLEMT